MGGVLVPASLKAIYKVKAEPEPVTVRLVKEKVSPGFKFITLLTTVFNFLRLQLLDFRYKT